MIKLDPSKNTKLKFNLNIVGTNELPKARLILDDSYGFTGYYADIENSVIVVNIPANDFQDDEKVIASIEVIIGNKIYFPWQDTLYFENQFKIDVTPVIDQDTTTESIDNNESVSVKPNMEPIIEQDDTEVLKMINEKKKLKTMESIFEELSKK